MSEPEPLIRNVSDTALWVVEYRALETERRDAVFRDPYARRLSGERGRRIVETLPGGKEYMWALVARTWVIDRFVTEQVRDGVDLVVNLAAGLDTRPYRMALPASLKWVEVDLPQPLAYKEEILGSETPRCRLERVRLDLADGPARRELFARLGRECRRALVITEGLVYYLPEAEVASLACDLAGQAAFQWWIVDLISPALKERMQKRTGAHLSQANALFQFAPAEGPAYFEAMGWKTLAVRSNLHAAARINRLPFWLLLYTLFPEAKKPGGVRPWAGICLLGRI